MLYVNRCSALLTKWIGNCLQLTHSCWCNILRKCNRKAGKDYAAYFLTDRKYINIIAVDVLMGYNM